MVSVWAAVTGAATGSAAGAGSAAPLGVSVTWGAGRSGSEPSAAGGWSQATTSPSS